MKESSTSGTVSLHLIHSDNHTNIYMTINGIIIDTTDASSPVRSLKANGQEIITGTLFDEIIPEIISSFFKISNSPNGLYTIDLNGIRKD